ncbi:MAG: redoxin domain-containing protein [Chloroflexi bacterium]|nr:redoxin domain-containing protein [Chloroflexota bacterium]MDA1227257.1 redoxin domain-containing protein [Chloroflexota bacterium]
MAAIVSTAMLATLVVVSCSQPQAAVPASTATPASLATATPTAIPDAPSNEPAPAVTFIPVTTSEIAQLGELAPDFELELFGGGKVLLSDYRGDVVVLNFWASWCPPCRKEMPAFERTWQEYRDQGVVFVGVAVQDHEPDARAFAEETGVSYPIGMDWNGRIFQSYRPTAMPTTFLIDREGVVSRRIVSYANEAMLKIFLKGQLDQ